MQDIATQWKGWLEENIVFIEGDWYANYHIGLMKNDVGVRDYYVDNTYHLFFRNYFHVFMNRRNLTVSYPQLNEPREEVPDECNDLWVHIEPYQSIFEKLIPYEGEEANRNLKEHGYIE